MAWRAIFIEPVDEPLNPSTLFGGILHDDRLLLDAGFVLCEDPVIVREVMWTRSRWRWLCLRRVRGLRQHYPNVFVQQY